jgi:acyl-coenzyme A thioesterase PaaI-like protein
VSDAPIHIAAHHPHCLGCGDENPASLGLSFVLDGDRVRSEFVLDRRHEGAPGFAHGGAVATALDDTLGTMLVALKRPAVTGRLEIDYRRPAFVGRTFQLEAWLESIDGRKIWLAGEMREDGEVIAAARALFIEVDRAHFAQGGPLPKDWFGGEGELPY